RVPGPVRPRAAYRRVNVGGTRAPAERASRFWRALGTTVQHPRHPPLRYAWAWGGRMSANGSEPARLVGEEDCYASPKWRRALSPRYLARVASGTPWRSKVASASSTVL